MYRWIYEDASNLVYVHAVEQGTCEFFACKQRAEYIRLWQTGTTVERVCQECLFEWLNPDEFTKLQTYN